MYYLYLYTIFYRKYTFRVQPTHYINKKHSAMFANISQVSKTNTRYVESSILNSTKKDKQNILLPPISIKQMKILNRQNSTSTMQLKQRTKDILRTALMNSSERKQKYMSSIQRFKTPRPKDDSFSQSQDDKNEQLYKINEIKKNTLLPPIQHQTTPNTKHTSTSPKNDNKSLTKSKNKSRLKTHCKILLQKNNLFPFYSPNNNKSAVNSKKNYDQESKLMKTNLGINEDLNFINASTQVLGDEASSFNISKISQISQREDLQFISKESAKQLLFQ